MKNTAQSSISFSATNVHPGNTVRTDVASAVWISKKQIQKAQTNYLGTVDAEGNVGIDLGKAGIDKNLLDTLIATGVKDHDARELSRLDVFGGSPLQSWIVGIKAAATLLNKGLINLDWGTLPSPWDVICPTLSNFNGAPLDQILLKSVDVYSVNVQSALIAAVWAIATTQDTAKSQGKKITADTAKEIQSAAIYLKPVNVALTKKVQSILHRKGKKDQQRKAAGEQVLEWLFQNGKFIRTIHDEKYYLYRATHKLMKLGTNNWHIWLYLLTGSNPASIEFRYFLADCETAASECGEKLEVVRVAHWDAEYQLLRVSKFDGSVYRLDGSTIEIESNGDGPALFDDQLGWAPYAPDYSTDGNVANWTFYDIPHWERKNEFGLLMQAWWMATFFSELCPTRPLLVLKGEKGSGKSMALRILLKMLFGPAVDVAGVPDKPDGFTALTSNSHIVIIDNLDELVKDIRDKIARISTGSIDQYRKLYTNNEVGTVVYRCWLAVTSRTPDTLQRDDLADRVLVLPVTRISDDHRTRESKFLVEAMQKRNQWWGDILLSLNQVVMEIRRNGIPERSSLRLADWEALGSVIAQTMGQGDIWENGVKEVKARQADLLLGEDPVVQAIEALLSSQQQSYAGYTTRELYSLASSALFGVDRPDASWPRSVRSFGRRLAGMQRELQGHLAKSGIQMSWKLIHGNVTYYFSSPSKWA